MRRHLAGEADDGMLSISASTSPVTALVAPGPLVTSTRRPCRAARVALGGVHRAALLADQDVADGVLVEQRVVDRQYGAAGIPENHLHALLLEGAEKDFSS